MQNNYSVIIVFGHKYTNHTWAIFSRGPTIASIMSNSSGSGIAACSLGSEPTDLASFSWSTVNHQSVQFPAFVDVVDC